MNKDPTDSQKKVMRCNVLYITCPFLEGQWFQSAREGSTCISEFVSESNQQNKLDKAPENLNSLACRKEKKSFLIDAQIKRENR